MPVDSTTGVAKPPIWPKRSATAVANGKTVEEPTIWMAWSCAEAPVVPDEQAARSAAAPARRVSFMRVPFRRSMKQPFGSQRTVAGLPFRSEGNLLLSWPSFYDSSANVL